MNLFDIAEEDYATSSKIRIKDASFVAQKLQAEYAYGQQVQTILDIGCGTGYSTLELSARFPNVRVVGIDSNPSYIEKAPTMTKNVEFYCVDITEKENFTNICHTTDLCEESVNIAISTYWLTSLSAYSKSNALYNISRLLKPNGLLYLLDLIWSDAHPILYRLNQSKEWKELIKENSFNNFFKLVLPVSDTPPSNKQISETWIEQFQSFDSLELYQIALNNRHYRFASMADMIQVLESICTTLHYIDDENSSHRYFVEFIRCAFDYCFLTNRELKLAYRNVMIVVNKKQ